MNAQQRLEVYRLVKQALDTPAAKYAGVMTDQDIADALVSANINGLGCMPDPDGSVSKAIVEFVHEWRKEISTVHSLCKEHTEDIGHLYEKRWLLKGLAERVRRDLYERYSMDLSFAYVYLAVKDWHATIPEGK